MGRKFFLRVSLVIAAIFAAFAPTSTVLALSESQMQFYAQNNILFYDPGARSCYAGNLSGDTVMAKVVDYMKGNNPQGFVLSDIGIAGVMANFQGESAFNPFRFQSDSVDGPGYGIAQFTPKSKITEPLRTDPRTANYFNDYYDIKYTYYDSETGLPRESVPMEVVDAWLQVQLDFFFGPSSEFETTKVGGYRNLGGTMGLSYISDNMTIHEALDAAQSPEDAARIFVWIAERPGDKEAAASWRSSVAPNWYSYVQSISAVSSGRLTISGVGDGSNVTVIGDSITVGGSEEILDALPGADIHAQVSKQFYSGTTDNPGGFTILQDLVNSGSLRNVLVYALGTNGGITADQAQQVVDLAGPSRTVVFVTNYTNASDYDANNNVFAKMKNDNPNVLIADWKGAIQGQTATYLGGDGIHPNEAGQVLFARIIANTINASASGASVCLGGAVNGGLNDSQAQALADYYNSSAVDENLYGLPYGKMNCVSFSAWFVQAFTTVGVSPSRSWGNGKDVANNLAQAEGLPTGTIPQPFAVFSVTKGATVCADGHLCGHTGVVVAIDGDTITTVEAAYQSTLAVVHKRDISFFQNTKYGDTFVYLDSILNAAELSNVISN